MHIIIDGYNVLKQVVHSGEISSMQRRAFINALGKYGVKKNHRITIVFDGGPDVWPTQEKDHGVTVIYAGIKQSADDLIKRAMKERQHNILVVTSDNEIKAAAARHDIVTMNAQEFYALLNEEIKPTREAKKNHGIIKTSQEENPLLDSLMRQDFNMFYKPDEEELDERRSKSNKLSKKERAYQQKIKKL